MKNITLTFIAFFSLTISTTMAQSALPNVVSGKVERIEHFQSKYVTSRNVDIWMPEGYDESKRYAVLYMHDGQMLFDPESSWNRQAWNVDDVAAGIFIWSVSVLNSYAR